MTEQGDDACTVAQAIEQTSMRFAGANLHYGHGTTSAWDEAVYLVLHATSLPDSESSLDRPVSPEQWQQIAALSERRISERVPLPYLLGECQYAGLRLRIAPGVLVPRSPIGPWLQDQGAGWFSSPPARVVDLGTGNGCLGLVAALEFPQAQVLLTDIDAQALSLARQNVADLGLSERVRLLQSSAVDALAAGSDFDLILCNPPYVNAADMAALPPEYQREPAHALAAGADGLAVITQVLARLPELLSARGLFVGEVGHSAAALQRRFPQLPFVWIEQPQGSEGLFVLTAESLGR